MKMKKFLLILMVVSILCVSNASVASAVWFHDPAVGTVWIHPDGTRAFGGWYWLDPDQNGISEKYYFDLNGALFVNRGTPDYCVVNEQGQWYDPGTGRIYISTNKVVESAHIGPNPNQAPIINEVQQLTASDLNQ